MCELHLMAGIMSRTALFKTLCVKGGTHPFLALRFFLRLIGSNRIRFVPLKSCILEEPAGGKLVIFFITNASVVDTPTVGAAQGLHAAIVSIGPEGVFDRMRFF